MPYEGAFMGTPDPQDVPVTGNKIPQMQPEFSGGNVSGNTPVGATGGASSPFPSPATVTYSQTAINWMDSMLGTDILASWNDLPPLAQQTYSYNGIPGVQGWATRELDASLPFLITKVAAQALEENANTKLSPTQIATVANQIAQNPSIQQQMKGQFEAAMSSSSTVIGTQGLLVDNLWTSIKANPQIGDLLYGVSPQAAYASGAQYTPTDAAALQAQANANAQSSKLSQWISLMGPNAGPAPQWFLNMTTQQVNQMTSAASTFQSSLGYTASQQQLNAMMNMSTEEQNNYMRSLHYKDGYNLGQWQDAETAIGNTYMQYFGRKPTDSEIAWAVGKTSEQITQHVMESNSNVSGLNIGQYETYRSTLDKISQSEYGRNADDTLISQFHKYLSQPGT